MEKMVFPEIVNEWMEIVKISSLSDADRMNEYCEKLRVYAEDNGSVYLQGYCYYYQGRSKYLSAELDAATELLTNALKYLSMAESWDMATRTCNAMGNIAVFQGDTSLAIDCYLKGLRMAQTYGIPLSDYNIRSNIANTQMSLGDHRSAVEMLKSCEQMVTDGLTVPYEQRAVTIANLAVCYTQLDETENAEILLNQMREHMSDPPSSKDIIFISLLETQLYNRTGNVEARDAAIARLHNLDLSSMDIFDTLTEFSAHAQLLLEIGKMDEFHALLARLNDLSESPTVKSHCLELQMKLCKITGDEDTYAKLAVIYYDVSQQREAERNRIVSHNITTRIRLDDEENRRRDAEQTNVVLRDRSEHDALTGLNNRYKLNELSEEAFQRSYLSGKPLTVEILDIDCYKKFNDNYGHQAGDECLVRIADAIRSMEEFPGVHTARYGGDEFVLVYEEYSKEEVLEMARTLRTRIHNLRIEHKFSDVCDHITISQGLFHSIPVAGNKLWDFMYGADMALYVVKNKAKDSYHVATDFNVVHEEYNRLKK